MDPSRPRPVVLDLTPEGEFRDPPPPGGWDGVLARLGRMAGVVALVAGLLALAALAFAALSVLIPVALGAAAIAWGSFRWRMWRLRRQGIAPSPGAQTSAVRVFVVRR